MRRPLLVTHVSAIAFCLLMDEKASLMALAQNAPNCTDLYQTSFEDFGVHPIRNYHGYCDTEWKYDWRWGGQALAAQCDSAQDSFRGSYCATEKACIFTFYQSESKTDEMSFIPSANGCSGDNSQALLKTTVLRDKVDTWGDVCVGEFTRCYSLEKHKAVYLQFVCSKQWEFPAGATHLSVDCTADRQAKLEYVQRKKNRRSRKRIAIWSGIVAGVVAVLIFLWFLRRMCLRRMARAVQDQDVKGGGPVTLFSVMLCGYWCLIQKVTTSSSWERAGLLSAHQDGNLEMSSSSSSFRDGAAGATTRRKIVSQEASPGVM